MDSWDRDDLLLIDQSSGKEYPSRYLSDSDRSMSHYASISSMNDAEVNDAEEYISVYGLHEALYNAVSDGQPKSVVQYIHQASGFDDDALEEVASDFDVGLDDIKREFLLK